MPTDANTPTIEKRKVPVRRPNAAYRSREYVQEQEVTALVQAAGQVGRHGARDATLILLAYRHGLRVSELVSLRWDQVDLQHGLLHVARRKHGVPSVHPLRGPSCVPCAACSGTTQPPPTCSSASARRRSRRMPCARSSAVPDAKRASRSQCTRTCSVMPPATSWPTRGRTRGQSNSILATATSSTPPGTQNSSPTASRISGATDLTEFSGVWAYTPLLRRLLRRKTGDVSKSVRCETSFSTHRVRGGGLSRIPDDAISLESQGLQGRNGVKLPQREVQWPAYGFAVPSLKKPTIARHRECGRASSLSERS